MSWSCRGAFLAVLGWWMEQNAQAISTERELDRRVELRLMIKQDV